MGWWPFGKQQEIQDIPSPVSNIQNSESRKTLNDLVHFDEQTKISGKTSAKKQHYNKTGEIEMDDIHLNQMQNVISNVKLADFQFGNLVKIPCFRDAGLIGLSTMFVLTSVIFFSHKNVTKALNWGYLGGMLGSLVGWEQCRSQRKRSFENVEKAKAMVKAKPHPMIHKKQDVEEK